jgi:NAD(P)-dependent dehydrogenase (short-subunit alcohol dehydrogenase family)
MARRLQPGNSGSSTSSNITVNCLHPGVVRTELSRYLITDPDSFASKVITLLASPFTLSPEQVRQLGPGLYGPGVTIAFMACFVVPAVNMCGWQAHRQAAATFVDL